MTPPPNPPRLWIWNTDDTLRQAFSVHEWADWMEGAREGLCVYHSMTATGRTFIETVFHGVDFEPSGPPKGVFVTRVITASLVDHTVGGLDIYRWDTCDGAKLGHLDIVKGIEQVEASLPVTPNLDV